MGETRCRRASTPRHDAKEARAGESAQRNFGEHTPLLAGTKLANTLLADMLQHTTHTHMHTCMHNEKPHAQEERANENRANPSELMRIADETHDVNDASVCSVAAGGTPECK